MEELNVVCLSSIVAKEPLGEVSRAPLRSEPKIVMVSRAPIRSEPGATTVATINEEGHEAAGHEGDPSCGRFPSLLRAHRTLPCSEISPKAISASKRHGADGTLFQAQIGSDSRARREPHYSACSILRAPVVESQGNDINSPCECNILTSACNSRTNFLLFPSWRGTVGLEGATSIDHIRNCNFSSYNGNFGDDNSSTVCARDSAGRKFLSSASQSSTIPVFPGLIDCSPRGGRKIEPSETTYPVLPRDVMIHCQFSHLPVYSFCRSGTRASSDRPIAQCHFGSRAGHCASVTKQERKAFIDCVSTALAPPPHCAQ